MHPTSPYLLAGNNFFLYLWPGFPASPAGYSPLKACGPRLASSLLNLALLAPVLLSARLAARPLLLLSPVLLLLENQLYFRLLFVPLEFQTGLLDYSETDRS